MTLVERMKHSSVSQALISLLVNFSSESQGGRTGSSARPGRIADRGNGGYQPPVRFDSFVLSQRYIPKEV